MSDKVVYQASNRLGWNKDQYRKFVDEVGPRWRKLQNNVSLGYKLGDSYREAIDLAGLFMNELRYPGLSRKFTDLSSALKWFVDADTIPTNARLKFGKLLGEIQARVKAVYDQLRKEGSVKPRYDLMQTKYRNDLRKLHQYLSRLFPGESKLVNSMVKQAHEEMVEDASFGDPDWDPDTTLEVWRTFGERISPLTGFTGAMGERNKREYNLERRRAGMTERKSVVMSLARKIHEQA